MKFSLKVSLGVHILLVAHFFSDVVRITGRLLTRSTGCNPVVVRTLVLSLKNSGILEVTRGPRGGTRLVRDPGKITLWDIFSAVDPESLKHLMTGVHTRSSLACPVGKRIPDILCRPYARIAAVIETEMRRITLSDLFEGLSLDEIEAHRALLTGMRKESRPGRGAPSG
ncbi:MAG: Rrf2 family transcriptional regulator [Deltaproteobacteria bacterium]|jgi:DNA-binding IscR family transcriptional regulator|nr:Rrf2 family transcriptional regulator [Deltaproteobacteria bacterium]